MLVGHYAVALIAKRMEPSINVGTLLFAAMFADIAWCVLLILGLEHVQFSMARGAGNYFHATDIAISHSLLMDVVWAAGLASLYLWWRHSRRGALFVFVLVLSHWLLDLISHHADMPIAPGVHTCLGLGLWNSIPATLIFEGGFWGIALFLYVRVTRTNGLLGTFGFWTGTSILTLAWLQNIAGPPPPNARAAPFVSLFFFGSTVAWAYWVNASRAAKMPAAGAGYIAQQ